MDEKKLEERAIADDQADVSDNQDKSVLEKEAPSIEKIYASPEFTQALQHEPVQSVATEVMMNDPVDVVTVEEPTAVLVPQPIIGNENKKKPNFWGNHKAIIATAIICSLLGGLVGGGTMAAFGGTKSGSSIPNMQAPINVTGGEISPVVAIAEMVSPAVVSITSKASMQNLFGNLQVAQGSGSGVIFRDDGYIVTNNHVITKASSLSVTLADGRTFDAQVVGADETTDLAVLKIEADGLTAAAFGDSDQVKVGELAVAIGNPLGADFAGTVTDGIISGTNRTIQAEDQTYQVLQTNAAINSGNSGGALVNSKGEVIGINSVKIQQTGVEGMGFAIPSNEVKPIIDEIMAKGYVSRPYVGIRGGDITAQLAQKYRLSVSNGVVVVETIAGSPALKAGLVSGDIIYKVDNELLKGMDHLTEILKQHQPGDSIKLLVDRNGQTLDIALTLGDQGQQQTVQPMSEQYSQQFVLPSRSTR